MICDRCHRPLNSSARICPYCGQIVHNDNPDDYVLGHDKDYGTALKEESKKLDRQLEFEQEAPTAENRPHVYEHKKSRLKAFMRGFLIFILLIGAGIAAACYAYTYFVGGSTKEYANSISKINTQIKSANDVIDQILKKDGEVFPASDIISKIPEAKDYLNKASEKLKGISSPSKYSNSNTKLKQALELNKMIYTQLNDVLSSPASDDIQKKKEQLYKYIEQCSNTYSSVKIEKNSFSLPDEIVSLSSKLNPWIEQQKSQHGKVSELMSTFSKYFQDISKVLLTYENSKADITQALEESRMNKTSWDELLSLINKNEKAISDVKASYIKIHAPSDLISFNDKFGSILDRSMEYYSKLKKAVLADMDFDEEEEPDANIVNEKINSIDAMYDEAEKINSTLSSDYKKFTQDIESEKSKYMNSEYIEELIKKQ